MKPTVVFKQKRPKNAVAAFIEANYDAAKMIEDWPVLSDCYTPHPTNKRLTMWDYKWKRLAPWERRICRSVRV